MHFAEGMLFFLPTRRNYNAFVLDLDKMLSDNLDRAFFGDQIKLREEQERADGKTEIQPPKATLTMLREWLTATYPTEASVIKNILAAMREVRTARMKPAHIVQPDEYDERYYEEQNRILQRTRGALGQLRMLLAKNPMANSQQVPDWLLKGEFKTY